MNIEELEKGHVYRLPLLDGEGGLHLIFVKRVGSGYPGNEGSPAAGVTSQFVLRALYRRNLYLHNQIPYWGNRVFAVLVCLAAWVYEFRAARRRGGWYWHTPRYAITADMCPICGHTDCGKDHDAKPEGARPLGGV